MSSCPTSPALLALSSWVQAGLIAAMNSMALPPSTPDWVMDSGATSHMLADGGNLLNPKPSSLSSRIMVGNGSSIRILLSGSMSLSTPCSLFHLHNVLVVPHLIKNLISVRQFTRDNSCPIEFDPCGFPIKDLHTKRETFRCNSVDDLYSLHPSTVASSSHVFLTDSSSSELWHQRLGHPRRVALSTLQNSLTFHVIKTTYRFLTHVNSTSMFNYHFPVLPLLLLHRSK